MMRDLLTPTELIELLPYLSVRDKSALDKLLKPIQATQVLPNPVKWITDNFYIPETQRPITFAPYQERCLQEALRQDEQGNFVYSTIVWSDVKKSAKTTIAAAVASWIAFNKPNARIRFVGNDLKQADSRVFNAIDTAIKLNPVWKNKVQVIQHKITFPNGSIIESVAVDPAGEAGGNDDMLEWTELWAAKHDVHKKMWSELTLSPTKFGKSFRWVDTYAGFVGESEILENLYNQGVKEGKQLDLGIPGLEAYANGRLFVLWNTQPRLSWQTNEYYQQESSTLTQSEFDRMHGNQWVSSEQTFVPREWWEACQVKSLALLERHQPIVVSLDAGVSNDCFAMVAVSRRDERIVVDNKIEIKSFPQVRYARAWKPPKGGKLDFDNEIEPELIRFCNEHHVIEVCYDEYQLHSFCTRLARKLKTFFRPFPQGTDRLIADKNLQDLIREKRIEHQGEPELAEHIQNANAKTEGDKLRLVKRSEQLKIDLAVALSMACDRVTRLW